VAAVQAAASTIASKCTTTTASLRDDRTIEVHGPGGAVVPDAGKRWCDRVSTEWRDLILRVSAEEGIDPAIVAGVMNVESCGDPNAGSYAGAQGLMQLMPGTFNFLMGRPSTTKVEPSEILDPELNVRLGARLLRRNLVKYKGNLADAAAAYNAGGARCGVYCTKGEGAKCCPPDPVWGYKTNCDYVAKVIASYNTAVRKGFAPGQVAGQPPSSPWAWYLVAFAGSALASAIVAARYA